MVWNKTNFKKFLRLKNNHWVRNRERDCKGAMYWFQAVAQHTLQIC